MKDMDINVLEELVKVTEALRTKYESMRNVRNEYERKFEETFRPITNPLKELVNPKPYGELSKESMVVDEIKKVEEKEDLKITKIFNVKMKLEDSFDIPNASKRVHVDVSFATPLSSPLDAMDETLRKNATEEEEEEKQSEEKGDKTSVEIKSKEEEEDREKAEEENIDYDDEKEEDGLLYDIYTGMYFTKDNKIDKNYGVCYSINKNWAIENLELKLHDIEIK